MGADDLRKVLAGTSRLTVLFAATTGATVLKMTNTPANWKILPDRKDKTSPQVRLARISILREVDAPGQANSTS
jgi:hypothetical protein